MRLYKYKSLQKLHEAYEILCKNQLHCSDIIQFNDPFEGMFIVKFLNGKKKQQTKINGVCHYQTKGIWEELLSTDSRAREIVDEIRTKKVCALSTKNDDVPLWSHYADSHKGISIEVDIPVKDLHEIKYFKDLRKVIHGLNSKIIEDQAMIVLETKIWLWRPESEWRIIQDEELYRIPTKIKNVFCGYKIEPKIFSQMQGLFPDIRFIKSTINHKEPWITFDSD